MSAQNKILVFGKTGQIGARLVEILGSRCLALDRKEADLSHPQNLKKIILDLSPSAVINAAAYTSVDKAEDEFELAKKINADAPAVMAEACKQLEIPLIHYSTDYVFDGRGEKPFSEKDQASPLNAYGKTKWMGEELIQKIGGQALIFRTSWVYDSRGNNFLLKILDLARNQPELKIVSDQFGTPSFAKDIAALTIEALPLIFEKRISGSFHLTNLGYTNWFEFGDTIISKALDFKIISKKPKITSISSSEFQTKSKRPMNSRLSLEKWTQYFKKTPRSWKAALDECLLDLKNKGEP